MKNEGSKEAGVLLDVWSRRPRCPLPRAARISRLEVYLA